MIIDKSHQGWIAGTLCLFALSTAGYWYYARTVPGGPTGGSWQGLLFGIAGSLLMIYAGLLSARKKVPRLPIGTAQTWLKGHIWLGLLSVPLILYHSAFRLGGLLEQALMLIFALIIVSGLFGLAMQQYLPRLMKSAVPAQPPREQIEQACGHLARTADQIMVEACGSLFQQPVPVGAEAAGGGVATAGANGSNGGPMAPDDVLRRFYVKQVRPFLAPGETENSPLGNSSRAAALFDQVRMSLPEKRAAQGEASLRGALDRLAEICDERRQYAVQSRIHGWLHNWLLIHIPLSMALLVLGIAHAVMSLWY